MTNAIEVRDLTKTYKKVKALDGVSFTVGEGELFGLLGVNGAGKSTFIHICAGLTHRTGGSVCVCGYDTERDMQQIKRIVDLSPQETSVAPNLTVRENIDFFAEIYGKRESAIRDEVIRRFRLGEVLERKAKTLSGGWARRLSIALALLSEPKVLFLDEPTLGLDVLARRELWDIIRGLRGNITVILTSHYLEEIESLCDRVAILAKGRLAEIGTVREITERMNESTFEGAFVRAVERQEENR